MSAGAVAERYAQALFELGTECGELSNLATQLRDFAHAYVSSRELRAAVNNPVVAKQERKQLLAAVAQKIGLSDLATRGVLVMSARGRLSALVETAARLTEMCDEQEGILRASVTTAAEMPESYFQSLSSQLAAATKKEVVLDRSIDEDLVGGAIAKVGDAVIDASVRGQLEKVERRLLSALASGAL